VIGEPINAMDDKGKPDAAPARRESTNTRPNSGSMSHGGNKHMSLSHGSNIRLNISHDSNNSMNSSTGSNHNHNTPTNILKGSNKTTPDDTTSKYVPWARHALVAFAIASVIVRCH